MKMSSNFCLQYIYQYQSLSPWACCFWIWNILKDFWRVCTVDAKNVESGLIFQLINDRNLILLGCKFDFLLCFFTFFSHNTCVRKQTRNWDMMLDRRRGRLIECAAKHKLFTSPNRTICPWISVICPCWSLHWLCFICLHYSFQSSWLAPTSWTQAANSTSCIFADDPVVQILYLQYQPVGSNVCTAGSNQYSRLYKVPLHPYDWPTHHTIYSIVTLSSITCLSSNTLSWSSVRSSQ